ncbi:MAG: B12-binding domain-containing radical SAM protein, partial [Fretibacterium sp.]|nr:B12-binding domain-containing radical SAM protein [Fretibacterium sp.]
MLFPEFSQTENSPLSSYWSLLSQAARPSRYSGSEWRGYPVPDWDGPEGKRLRVCLAFPDVYEIGMSYYGFQLLASLIRGLGFLVDRAYCPWVDMEALLRARDIPLLSVEQRRPLGEFDIVAFTLQHETGYTNVLTMLDLSGIPLRSQDRMERAPLVIAGGHGALVPEPLSPFIDLFCIGEAEVLLSPLLDILTGTKGERRSSRLAASAKLRGIYVPSLYSTDAAGQPIPNGTFPFPVERQILKDLDDAPVPEDIAVPSVSVVHDRAALELFRGCTRGCRFCQAGMICRPVRERSVEAVMEA